MIQYVTSLEKAFYKLHKRITFQDLKISIENRKGSIRSGIDKDGHKWRSKMHCDYGYIRMSKKVRRMGADKENLDVFVGDNHESDKVFVLHLNRADNGKFDEDKVFLGFDSRKEVMAMFNKCYDKIGQKLYGGMIQMNMAGFKRRLGVQTHGMIKSLHVLALDLIKAKKTHVKAHFRRLPNGSLVFIKDFDYTRHSADHVVEKGKTYKINNPRSKHHGKHAEVTGYMPETDKKKHYVMAVVDGKRSDLKPEHFEHVDGGHVPVNRVIKRTPVKDPKKIVRTPVKKDPAAGGASVKRTPVKKKPPAVPGKRPDAPFVLDPKDVLANEYHFDDIMKKWLAKDPEFKVKTENTGKGVLRHYFTVETSGAITKAGYIQTSDKAKKPHKVVFGAGEKNPQIAELYKKLCKAWRDENGGWLDLKTAFGDIGIRLNEDKDGNMTLAGSTYVFRRTLAKYAAYDKKRNHYTVNDPKEIFDLLEKLPPFYTKEELNVRKASDTGRDGSHATGSGAGDSGKHATSIGDGGSGGGTPDGRGISGGSTGGAGGLRTSPGKGKKPKKLKSYTIKELHEIIHTKGVLAPDPHIKVNPRLSKEITLYDHQKTGAEAILSAFDYGRKGFLLADDVGTGKTYTGTAVVKHMKPKRCVLSVPSDGVRKQWLEVFEEAGIKATAAKGSKTDFSKATGVLIATDATLALNPTLHEPPCDLFMIDEAHRGRNLATSLNPDSRANKTYDLVRKQMETGGKTLYMSATPYEKPWQAKIYEALEMWEPGEFDDWVSKHGVNVRITKRVDPATGDTYEYRDYAQTGNGKSAVKRTLMSHIRSIAAGTFLARELQPAGVKLANHFHKINLDPETKKQFNHVMTFFDMAKKAATSRADARMIGGQKTLCAHRFMEAAKLPTLIKAAKDELYAGRKVAIMTGYKNPKNLMTYAENIADKVKHINPGAFATFKDELKKLGENVEGTFDVLKKEFPGAVTYHGGMSESAKQVAKEQYNNGSANVMIATQASADTGISLHDTIGDAPRSQFNLTLPWSAISMKQLAGRSHRLGSKSDTKMHWMFGDDPSEQYRAIMVSKKMEIMGASSAGVDVTDNDDLYVALNDFDFADGKPKDFKGFRPNVMKKSFAFGHVISQKKINTSNSN